MAPKKILRDPKVIFRLMSNKGYQIYEGTPEDNSIKDNIRTFFFRPKKIDEKAEYVMGIMVKMAVYNPKTFILFSPIFIFNPIEKHAFIPGPKKLILTTKPDEDIEKNFNLYFKEIQRTMDIMKETVANVLTQNKVNYKDLNALGREVIDARLSGPRPDIEPIIEETDGLQVFWRKAPGIKNNIKTESSWVLMKAIAFNIVATVDNIELEIFAFHKRYKENRMIQVSRPLESSFRRARMIYYLTNVIDKLYYDHADVRDNIIKMEEFNF